jgi:hypothetical protein
MPNLDSLIAPRALTSEELCSLIAPQLIAYGVANRAFTHAYLWDEERRDGATRVAIESVLVGIGRDAESSVNDWLSDMQVDGEPRFFNKAGLKKAIDALFVGAAQLFCKAEDADSLEQLIAKIEDRDPAVRALLIEMAAE